MSVGPGTVGYNALVNSAIASKASIPKKTTDTILTATVEAIIEAVAVGDKVSLVGFGSFEPRERQAREGRNPKTGATMQIPATKVPAFSAGKLFKETVSSSKKVRSPSQSSGSSI